MELTLEGGGEPHSSHDQPVGSPRALINLLTPHTRDGHVLSRIRPYKGVLPYR